MALDLSKPHKLVVGKDTFIYFQNGLEYDKTGKFIARLKNTSKFICPICEKGFDNESQFEKHTQWHKNMEKSK